MRTITIVLMLMLVGCGEQSIVPMEDAGYVGDAGLPPVDAELPDAATDARDSSTEPDSGQDSGRQDGGAPDSAVPDAGTDAGRQDSGTDSSVPDAGSDAGTPDTGTPDAGPPRPVGAAVDVSGSRCALDTTGQVWCWGRWTPVEDVRLLGTGFDSVSGSCALRGRQVWCAEFTTETMIPVIDGSATLEVNSLAEYSDLARGCGIRTTPEGWGEAVCWTDGGAVLREGGTGAEVVAVSATTPREVGAAAGCEAYDLNPPATCRAEGTRVSCVRDIGGMYNVARPVGDHYTLGFALSCAHNAGSTTCTALASWSIPDDGGFHDHAVSWPIGPVGAVPAEARGICISGSTLRCYDTYGTLAYTVNW